MRKWLGMKLVHIAGRLLGQGVIVAKSGEVYMTGDASHITITSQVAGGGGGFGGGIDLGKGIAHGTNGRPMRHGPDGGFGSY